MCWWWSWILSWCNFERDIFNCLGRIKCARSVFVYVSSYAIFSECPTCTKICRWPIVRTKLSFWSACTLAYTYANVIILYISYLKLGINPTKTWLYVYWVTYNSYLLNGYYCESIYWDINSKLFDQLNGEVWLKWCYNIS